MADQITSLSGYQSTDFNDWFKLQNSISKVLSDPYKTIETTVATWHPPTEGRPAVSYIPPTPAEFEAVINSGWESSARSIDPIGRGGFVSYSVNAGVYGAFLGLDRKDKDDLSNGSIKHGLLVDGDGVWVFESGVATVKLRDIADVETTLRIIRQPDNEVVYMVVTGSESIFHQSSVHADTGTLYGYGRLYSHDDIIEDAAIAVGKLQYGRA